jgi:hypothetical protein
MKKLSLVMLSLITLHCAMAQQKNCWTLHENSTPLKTDKAVNRLSFPKTFLLYNLNVEAFGRQLISIVDHSEKKSCIITLPNANGNDEQFEIYEASNFEPDLQVRFPEIRAFSGKGITDKYATLKMSIAPTGMQAMIFRTDAVNECIEPYASDHSVYAVFQSQQIKSQLPWKCYAPEERLSESMDNAILNAAITNRSGGDLKTLRLAQSVTAEYSNYFGATSASQVSLVLAAINATLTRCNGLYERDLAIHLNLISNTTSVIYYNAATDPYDAATSGASGTWNAQLQSTLTTVIGETNYDIGHLFGASGGGGNAGCIGCICTNGSKGSGYTSPADGIPQGDNFDIDYVVHEVGHQLGANHTFSMTNEATGVNKEVGSGITIMGYAGITGQDVAPHSIDMYHQASIAQIQTNLLTKTCPVTTSITTANTAPVVALLSNYTIPKSTPFALTGSATDANGDALTYCWEQNDNASASQTATASVASETKVTGPNWISFKPSTSPTRYFPQLPTILAGANITGPLTGGDAGVNTEALSSVGRTLNFRLTVRDNSVYRSTAPIKVGQTNFTDMSVTVSAAAGPFVVTSPNAAVTWLAGSSQAITWNVAGTAASPVSCANVKISLSTDGGLSFPTILSTSTPNDGTETLVIPVINSTTARIKIESVGNIFFDISNTNFNIATNICNAPTGITSSLVTSNSATLSWTAITGVSSYNIQYRIIGTTVWTTINSITNSKILTGLTSSKNYEFQIQTVCNTTSSSAFSAISNFTTLATGCSDNFEPNNTNTTAKPITANTAITGLINNYSDIDWYSFTTTSPNTNFKLALSGMNVDYDLSVYNSSMSLIGSAANLGNTAEQVTYNTTSAGTYFVKVNGYNNKQLVTYDFNAGTTASTSADTKLIVGALAQGNNLGTTTFITNTSASSGYAGATGTYNAGVTARTGVLNTAASGSAYFEFTLVPSSGNAISLSGISFASRGTSTGPLAYTIRSSLDGYTSDLAVGSLLNTSVWSLYNTASMSLNASVGIAVTVRIYGYNGTGTASSNVANWRIDDLIINGSVNGFNASQCYTLLANTASTLFRHVAKNNADAYISIAPNPAHDYLKININEAISKNAILIIYNANGVVVKRQNVFSNQQDIDISMLSKGFYLLKLVNGEKILNEKFIRE